MHDLAPYRLPPCVALLIIIASGKSCFNFATIFHDVVVTIFFFYTFGTCNSGAKKKKRTFKKKKFFKHVCRRTTASPMPSHLRGSPTGVAAGGGGGTPARSPTRQAIRMLGAKTWKYSPRTAGITVRANHFFVQKGREVMSDQVGTSHLEKNARM